jgi:hypothetical protein
VKVKNALFPVPNRLQICPGNIMHSRKVTIEKSEDSDNETL